MSIIAQHAHARARKKRQEGELEEMMKEPEASPMKTVLGSLSLQNQVQPAVTSKAQSSSNNQISRASTVPQSIEEVPFRKLILFFVTFGIFLLSCGVALIVLHHFYQQEYKSIRPMIVIGPVLAGAGVFSILFSFEVCVRLYKNQKRMRDPDLDNLVNIHEIKHWMDPGLIGFGWGLYQDKDDKIAIEIDGDGKK